MRRGALATFSVCFALLCFTTVWAQSEETLGDQLFAEAAAMKKKAVTRQDRLKVIAKYGEAVDAFRKENNKVGVARAARNSGNILADLGDFKAAIEVYKLGARIAAEAGDADLQADLQVNTGCVYFERGDMDKALPELQAGLDYYKDANPTKATKINHNIALVHEKRGELDKALEFFGRVRALAEQTGDQADQAKALDGMGGVYSVLGDYEKAFNCWNKAEKLVLLTEWTNRSNETIRAGIRLSMGAGYLRLGQAHQAVESYENALRVFRRAGIRLQEAQTLEAIAEACMLAGQSEKAATTINRAIVILNKIGAPAGNAYAKAAELCIDFGGIQKAQVNADKSDNLLIKARVATLKGDLQKALRLYQDALVAAGKSGAELDLFASHTGLGVVYERLGDREADPAPDALIQEMELCDVYDKAKLDYEGLVDQWSLLYTRWMLGYKNLLERLDKAKLSAEGRRRMEPFRSMYAQAERSVEAIFSPDPEPASNKPAPSSDEPAEPKKPDLKTDAPQTSDADEQKEDAQLVALLDLLYKPLGQVKEVLDAASLSLEEREAYEQLLDSCGNAWEVYHRIIFSDPERKLLDRALALTEQAAGARAKPKVKASANANYRKAMEHYGKSAELTEAVRTRLATEAKGRFFNLKIAGFRRTAPYEGMARVSVKTGKPEEAFKWSDFTKARSLTENLERRNLAVAMNVPKEWVDYESECEILLANRRKRRLGALAEGNTEAVARMTDSIRGWESRLLEFRKEFAAKFPAFTAATAVGIAANGIQGR